MTNVIDIKGILPKKENAFVQQEAFVMRTENGEYYAAVTMGPFKQQSLAALVSEKMFETVEASISDCIVEE